MACLLCLVIFDYEFVAWTFCGRPEDLYWECFFQRGFTLAPNSSQRHHWSENISDPTEGLGIERIPGCGFSKDWEKPASGLRVPVACCRHIGSQDRQLCCQLPTAWHHTGTCVWGVPWTPLWFLVIFLWVSLSGITATARKVLYSPSPIFHDTRSEKTWEYLFPPSRLLIIQLNTKLRELSKVFYFTFWRYHSLSSYIQ